MKRASETVFSSESCFFKINGRRNKAKSRIQSALVYMIYGGFTIIIFMTLLVVSPNTLKNTIFSPKLFAIIIKLIQNMLLLPSNMQPISDMLSALPGHSILARRKSTLLKITQSEAKNEKIILRQKPHQQKLQGTLTMPPPMTVEMIASTVPKVERPTKPALEDLGLSLISEFIDDQIFIYKLN